MLKQSDMKKRNMTRSLKYALLTGLMACISCTDWLSIAPEDDLIKEKFWTKTADVEGALAASYNALRKASLESLIFGELRADLVSFTGNNFTAYAQIAASNISPTNSVIRWRNYYTAINLANTLMHFDDEVLEKDRTFTPKIKDAIEAEAIFIRSVAFFYLVRLWKDVPLVMEASISDTSNLYIGKSTEKEVLHQIIEDLLVAKDMAYTTEFRGTDYFYGRANKYSIMALLADIYLWDEQYEKCIEYCDQIMNSELYQLEPTETFFNIYYPGNSPLESIIEIQYNDDLEGQENPIYYNMISFAGGNQVTMVNRNINMVMLQDDLRRFGGKGAPWKYQGKDALGLIPRIITERDANWILYRYADILLMKAEACIELNRFDEANTLIAETLLRAGMSYQPENDRELLRQALLDERAREFLFEGKRWFDLLRAAKRNNFEKKQIIINMILSGADIKQQAILRTKVYDTMSYYLPIPENELIYNQNLEQNPYYDR
ncbi:MAG TPA: RagB/SusD family nutrient uptake outer membrane protein [Bacteroidaceae bacterium]|nr:RagB/SusD family nutrient uptake outer membrane protein [Bacteroidaceae bacterium]